MLSDKDRMPPPGRLPPVVGRVRLGQALEHEPPGMFADDLGPVSPHELLLDRPQRKLPPEGRSLQPPQNPFDVRLIRHDHIVWAMKI